MRAVQVFTLSSPDQAGLRGEFKGIKEAGFNTIILRVFKNPYDRKYRFIDEKVETGVYFLSDKEPVVADVLTPVIKTAHELGLDVFAWITTRKSQWILLEHPEWDSPSIDIETGKMKPGGHLDIYRSDVEKRITEMLLELSKTGIDGILIQDDFVSRQYEDLMTNAWRSFRNRPFTTDDLGSLFNFSINPPGYTSLYYQWTRHKSQAMASTLNRWINRIRLVNPSIKIAVNLYYETVISPQFGRLWLSQDLEDLLNLPVDFWAVMGYQRQISKELGIPIEKVADKLRSSAERLETGNLIPEDRILWKFQAHDWTTGDLITESEWKKLLEVFNPNQMVLVPYRGVQSIGAISRVDLP
ncbi:hypothetical protein K8T06_14670 [bacterium]|nr:hypothetical protein [bacterium]